MPACSVQQKDGFFRILQEDIFIESLDLFLVILTLVERSLEPDHQKAVRHPLLPLFENIEGFCITTLVFQKLSQTQISHFVFWVNADRSPQATLLKDAFRALGYAPRKRKDQQKHQENRKETLHRIQGKMNRKKGHLRLFY